jgi:general secretion pathway protein G
MKVTKKNLIMLGIFIVLCLFVWFKWYSHVEVSPVKEVVTQINLRIFNCALREFYEDCSRYPTTEEGLAVLISNPGIKGWRGPYISRSRIPSDQWGHPYYYSLEPSTISAGRDGIIGTKDDIQDQPSS